MSIKYTLPLDFAGYRLLDRFAIHIFYDHLIVKNRQEGNTKPIIQPPEAVSKRFITMSTENKRFPVKGIGISVLLSIILAVVGVVGIVTALTVNVVAGAAIFFVSLVLWAFTCINTDFAVLGSH